MLITLVQETGLGYYTLYIMECIIRLIISHLEMIQPATPTRTPIPYGITTALWRSLSRLRIISTTVECLYNSRNPICTILYTVLRWRQQNVNQTPNSQQKYHTSRSLAIYEVSVMIIVKKIDRIITTSHCIWLRFPYSTHAHANGSAPSHYTVV